MEGGGERNIPLLKNREEKEGEEEELGLVRRVWEESKKLWKIVGPAMVSRFSLSGMNVITQAFAGHLGNLELASISISITVIIGFSFGLLVSLHLLFYSPF